MNNCTFSQALLPLEFQNSLDCSSRYRMTRPMNSELSSNSVHFPLESKALWSQASKVAYVNTLLTKTKLDWDKFLRTSVLFDREQWISWVE